jgi:hypothetical protein
MIHEHYHCVNLASLVGTNLLVHGKTRGKRHVPWADRDSYSKWIRRWTRGGGKGATGITRTGHHQMLSSVRSYDRINLQHPWERPRHATRARRRCIVYALDCTWAQNCTRCTFYKPISRNVHFSRPITIHRYVMLFFLHMGDSAVHEGRGFRAYTVVRQVPSGTSTPLINPFLLLLEQ